MGPDDETRSSSEASRPGSDDRGLHGLTENLGLEPASHDLDPLAGKDIGGVTIIRLIAEGGMGRVYEGKQEKPNRTVAVKVMRPGLTSPSILKRFEHEAEVLGRLQHPGIAHIYSVGVHRMGNATVPYFVMEYIAGAKSLTQYANDFKLSVRQRLDLFRSVCEAVAHGHQKGVIHRDLKPSNILVDASGQPKVIDFGVARATDSDMALTTMQTDVGQLIGTLQYMSPEQFEADPSKLDVRSDVYALGVILYELLAGMPPHELARKAIYEAMQIVRQESPPSLSRLNKSLHRDLSLIAEKCLRKEKAQRYANASELAGDIARYLDGYSISVVPPTPLDLVIRFARRNRALTIASAMAIATALALLSTGLYLSNASQRERTQRQSAQLQVSRMRYASLLGSYQRSFEAKRFDKAAELLRGIRELATESSDANLADPIEVRLLAAEADKSYVTLGGHDGAVRALAISSDGCRLATAANEATHLWDTSSGRTVRVLRHRGGRAASIVFSPDSKYLATGTDDGRIFVWGAKTGEEHLILNGRLTQRIVDVAFTADSTHLVATSTNTAQHWSVPDGKETMSLKLPGGRCAVLSNDGSFLAASTSVDATHIFELMDGEKLSRCEDPNKFAVERLFFSPNGRKFATLSCSPTSPAGFAIVVWETLSGKTLAIMKLSSGLYSNAMFDPTGQRMIISTRDGGCGIFDAESGKFLMSLVTNGGVVNAMSVNAFGFVGACSDHVVRIWNRDSVGQPALLTGHSDSVTAVACRVRDPWIFSGSEDGTVRIWGPWSEPLGLFAERSMPPSSGPSPRLAAPNHEEDASNSQTPSPATTMRNRIAALRRGSRSLFLRGFAYTPVGYILPPEDLEFTPDGRTFVALSAEDGVLSVWDAKAMTPIHINPTGTDGAQCFSVAPGGGEVAIGCKDGEVRIFDLTSARVTRVMRGHTKEIVAITHSPDGSRLATTSLDHTVRLWDGRSGAAVASVRAARGSPIAFSEDSRTLATVDDLNRLELTETTDGARVGKSQKRYNPLKSIAFSPDSERIAAICEDGTVCIIRSADGQPVGNADPSSGGATPEGAGRGGIRDIAFMPGRPLLFTASHDVHVWNTQDARCQAKLDGTDLGVTRLCINHNGSRLATVQWDGSITLWDAESLTRLVSFRPNVGSILRVKFSPDGQQLAVLGDDKAQMFGLPNSEIVRNRFAVSPIAAQDKILATPKRTADSDRPGTARPIISGSKQVGRGSSADSHLAPRVENRTATLCGQNLRRIATGIWKYVDQHGAFPSDIRDDRGTCTLSWRVRLLPYIDEGALHKRFRLDEPWDSKTNRNLLPLMPLCYACPAAIAAADKGLTAYVGVKRAGCFLDDHVPGGTVSPRSFGDGLSRTAVVLEAPPTLMIEWTRPDLYLLDAGKFLRTAQAASKTTGFLHKEGCITALFADGHVRLLNANMSTDSFNALLTRAAGDASEP